MQQKSLYLTLLILLMGVSNAFSLSFNQVWNSSTQQGTSSSYGWDATKVRNMAYGNGKLYLVYEQSGIKVVNAQTGASISDLNKTGISGGAIALADVAYFDGKVVACNITVSTASPLKVYVWDTETSAPRVLLSTTDFGGLARLGDHIGLSGNWQNGTISFGNGSTIVNYSISNGVVNTSPSTVNITTNGSTALTFQGGFKVQRHASGYYVNGKNGAFSELNLNGVRANYLSNSHQHGIGFTAFTYAGNNYVLTNTFVGSGNYVGGAVDLFNSSSGWSGSALATLPAAGLGVTPNTNCTGDAIASANNNGVEIWALSTNQGIAHYKHGTVVNPDPDPDPNPGTTENPSFSKKYIQTYPSWNTASKSRDMAVYNNRVYAVENNGVNSAIHAIDANNGNELTSQKVVNEWFNSFSVTNDGAGNLYIPTNNTGGGSNFLLSKLALPNSVTKVNNHQNVGAGLRTDFIEAYKLNSSTTYVAGVSVNATPRTLRVWTINSSDNSITGVKTFLFPSGDANGTGGDVKWISSNKVLVTGAQKKPAILTLNMSNETYDRVEVNTTAANVGGAAYFTINSTPYIVVPTNGTGQFKVLNIANPNSPIEVAANTEDIGSTTNASSHMGIETVVTGGLVSIYVWSSNNGLGVWELNFGSGVIPPNPDPDPDPEPEPDDPTKLKREMRAVWLSAMGLDWPYNKINGTTAGQKATQRTLQQNEIKTYFRRLEEANINTVFLHIRPAADAMYPSNIVPWSHYLTGWSNDSRGTDPGYDPLRFAIDEAHKRGMELHGWMNPFRYTANATNHPSSDYIQQQHPGWILNFGNAGRILDPGNPAVRQHIADITQEVIQNYPDIDGIVWDDYFYDASISTQDNASYNAHNPGGLSKANWRRSNINKTVELVYNTIQSVNPGIRFGISPRGFWGMRQADANQYGVTLPSGLVGADNYNGIYADGMAWLSQGTIDYISPQLYWGTATVGDAKTDYNVLAGWWQSVANKFNRHFYSSHGLYRMFEPEFAWWNAEIGRQIQRNRDLNKSSPGSIFFSTSDFFNTGREVNVYVKDNYFQDPILPPVITWKVGNTKPTRVDNVSVNGNTISWTNYLTDVSFALFAVPKNLGVINIKDCDYMLKRVWTNTNSYNTSEISSLRATHNFAVAVVNRYGAMSDPKFESSLSSSISTDKAIADYQVFSSPQGIHVQVEKPEQVRIYTVSGVLQHQSLVEDKLLIDLPKGIYIVQIGGDAVKVVR